jgi:uncharacterized membrane protein
VSARQPIAPRSGAPADHDLAGATRTIESRIARVLIIGTYVAVALVLVGVVAMLAAGIDPLAHGRSPSFDLLRIPADLVAGRPEGFLWAGLAVVLALPLGRVVVSGIGFLAAGDRRLALISLAVLLVVCGSVVVAIRIEG